MKYYVYINSDDFSSKQPLHVAIRDLFRTYKGVIVPSGEPMQVFGEEVLDGIRKLCNKHKDCKPFPVKMNSYLSENYDILVEGVTRMEFLPVTKEL